MLKKYEETDIAAIATAIREKTGGDKTYKTSQMPEGVNEVFEAGKKAEYVAFWNAIQINGTRIDYSSAFKYWDSEYIRPIYKVIPTRASSCSSLFEYCKQLKKVEAEYFDFSQKERGTTNGSAYNSTFNACVNLEEVEDVGLVAQYSYSRTFAYCSKLKKIAKIGSDENTLFLDAFYACRALEDLTVDGLIANDFDIRYSPLKKASIESIYFHLKPDTEFTVTFSKAAVDTAFETSEGAADGSVSAEWEELVYRLPYITFSLI